MIGLGLLNNNDKKIINAIYKKILVFHLNCRKKLINKMKKKNEKFFLLIIFISLKIKNFL